jgi:signaling intermediate in Toll pathway protein
MGQMLVNIFGKNAVPTRKYRRMMYWMPKFKHLSPWPLPDPVPNDAFELARLAMERIGTVDIQSVVTTYDVRIYVVHSMFITFFFFTFRFALV